MTIEMWWIVAGIVVALACAIVAGLFIVGETRFARHSYTSPADVQMMRILTAGGQWTIKEPTELVSLQSDFFRSVALLQRSRFEVGRNLQKDIDVFLKGVVTK